MDSKKIITENCILQVNFHQCDSRLLLEAWLKGHAPVGWVRAEELQAEAGDYQLDVCQDNRKIIRLRKILSHPDEHSLLRIPPKVYQTMLSHFNGWLFEPQNVLQSMHYTYLFCPVQEMGKAEIAHEIPLLCCDMRMLMHIKKVLQSDGPALLNPAQAGDLDRELEYLTQRIAELRSQLDN